MASRMLRPARERVGRTRRTWKPVAARRWRYWASVRSRAEQDQHVEVHPDHRRAGPWPSPAGAPPRSATGSRTSSPPGRSPAVGGCRRRPSRAAPVHRCLEGGLPIGVTGQVLEESVPVDLLERRVAPQCRPQQARPPPGSRARREPRSARAATRACRCAGPPKLGERKAPAVLLGQHLLDHQPAQHPRQRVRRRPVRGRVAGHRRDPRNIRKPSRRLPGPCGPRSGRPAPIVSSGWRRARRRGRHGRPRRPGRWWPDLGIRRGCGRRPRRGPPGC
jgi:hypothetical protein